MQGLLELADLPYVGAGVLGSAVSMDKDVMKRLMRERDLPVVEYLVTSRGASDVEQICKRLPFPVFREARQLGIVGGDLKGEKRTARS